MDAQSPRRFGSLPALSSIVAVGAAWQAAAMWIANPVFLPGPREIVQALPAVLRDGLVQAYLETMWVFVLGLAMTLVVAIPMGILAGMNKYIRYAIDPLVIALYSTPGVALVPLIVVWLGLGEGPKYTLIFFVAFFPVLVNTQLGISQVDPRLLELHASFGGTRWERMRQVALPAALPHVFAGIRIAAPRAFVGVLAAEMLVSLKELGGLVLSYGNSYQTAKYFVPVLLIAVTSLLLAAILNQVERRMTPQKRAS